MYCGRNGKFKYVIATNVNKDCKMSAINVFMPNIRAKQSSCSRFAIVALQTKTKRHNKIDRSFTIEITKIELDQRRYLATVIIN